MYSWNVQPMVAKPPNPSSTASSWQVVDGGEGDTAAIAGGGSSWGAPGGNRVNPGNHG